MLDSQGTLELVAGAAMGLSTGASLELLAANDALVHTTRNMDLVGQSRLNATTAGRLSLESGADTDVTAHGSIHGSAASNVMLTSGADTSVVAFGDLYASSDSTATLVVRGCPTMLQHGVLTCDKLDRASLGCGVRYAGKGGHCSDGFADRQCRRSIN